MNDLIEALVAWAGQGALIIDHMARTAASGHSEGYIEESLNSVLRSALEPLADRHAATDIAAAAEVLADVVETVGSEIYLVDMDALEDET